MKYICATAELINHMKRKGITFEKESESEATEFLKNNNYYLKLAAYRKNYQKDNKGNYIGLDFAYLKELSRIDARLRYIVFHMTADIEHFLKVKLLQSVENNPVEDGYEIVKKFLAKDKLYILKEIQAHKSSMYCKDLIEKYYPYFPVWVFIELISFRKLAYLCNFYETLYGEKLADNILLNSVRDIRNACAHSNCLINNLERKDNIPHQTVKDEIIKIKSIGQNSINKKLKNKFIYDFVCLLLAYDSIVPDCSSKQHRHDELKELFNNRMTEHAEWFKTNNLLTSSYKFLHEILLTFI